MADLVICMGSGKGTWAYAYQLIDAERWNRVFIITSPFFSEKIGLRQPHIHLLPFDDKLTVEQLADEYAKQLKPHLSGDVAVNFVSGDGREHLALVGALLKLGIGLRFVHLTQKGIVEV
jgi:hypothetical protein